jgi:hypothetical protein
MLSRTGRWAPSHRLRGSWTLLSLRIQAYRPFNSHASMHSLVRVSRREVDFAITSGPIDTEPSAVLPSTLAAYLMASHEGRSNSEVQHRTNAHWRFMPDSTEARQTESRLRQPLSLQHFHVYFKVCIRDPFHRSLAVLVCYRSRHNI